MRAFVKPLLIALLLTSCRLPWQSKVLLEVGSYKLTEQDIAYRQKIVQILYPGEKRPDFAVNQLTQAFTFAQIFAQNDQPIRDEHLIEEERRIQNEVQEPAK